jgi:hypothetical protein
MLFDTLDEPAGDHYTHSFIRNCTNGSDFSLCMVDPGHRSLVLLCADLTTGKECSWSLHGYDFS